MYMESQYALVPNLPGDLFGALSAPAYGVNASKITREKRDIILCVE